MKKSIIILALVVSTSSIALTFGGGGSAIPRQHDFVSEFEQMNRWHRYWQDRKSLIASGQLKVEPFGLNHAMYDFPLNTTESYPGYHGVSNFVDLDAGFPGNILDYNCGTRSYDLDNGYNHQGIDFFTWPYE